MKIDKKDFDKLYSDSITKKEYDEIIGKIDKRFAEICKKYLKRKYRMWYDYGNCSYEGYPSNGYFDPNLYKDSIDIGGEYVTTVTGNEDNCFPTFWLWGDFEQEIEKEKKWYAEQEAKEKREVEEKKAAKKAKEDAIRDNLDSLMASVKLKLTAEEMQIIRFKYKKSKRGKLQKC